MPTTPSPALQRNLRAARRRLGMTLEQVAQATELSRGYLSLLERGLKSPSIGTLMKLAKVLEQPVERLFDPTASDETEYVIDRVGDTPEAVSIQALAAHLSNKMMEPFIMRPVKRATRTPTMRHVRHAGEELLYVLNGTVEIELAGERFRLRKGESIYFSGEKEHAISSIGATQAEVLLVIAAARSAS